MHVLELGKFAEVAVAALKPDLPSMEPVRELVPVANACTGSGSKVCGLLQVLMRKRGVCASFRRLIRVPSGPCGSVETWARMLFATG